MSRTGKNAELDWKKALLLVSSSSYTTSLYCNTMEITLDYDFTHCTSRVIGLDCTPICRSVCVCVCVRVRTCVCMCVYLCTCMRAKDAYGWWLQPYGALMNMWWQQLWSHIWQKDCFFSSLLTIYHDKRGLLLLLIVTFNADWFTNWKRGLLIHIGL